MIYSQINAFYDQLHLSNAFLKNSRSAVHTIPRLL